MLEERFTYLFKQYYRKEGSAEERAELFELLKTEDHDKDLKALMDSHYEDFQADQNPFSKAQEAQMLLHILQAKPDSGAKGMKLTKVRKLWPSIAAAASLFLVIGAGLLFYKHSIQNNEVQFTYQNDIAPGQYKATLTLADGQTVALSSAKKELIARDQFHYSDGSPITGSGRSQAGLNTIKTPNGGQYTVTLPDGTRVWLNAASSLKFPAHFSDEVRKVELTGEGYFEVAKVTVKGKNKLAQRQPFIVYTDQQQVEVLGTHFNINAYANEVNVKTTLVEGSVRVSAGSDQVMLIPGQQARLNGRDLKVMPANLEDDLAWKNGYFRFNDESIESVMRKLSRWYNLEVQYQGSVSNESFNGKISRNNNISQVLNALESTKTVHFKIEGRRITVIQ
jgi:transmembrane sensor